MIRNDTNEQMVAWVRLLNGEVNNIVYRLSGQTEPTQVFFRELAESLEHIAKRVRRELKE